VTELDTAELTVLKYTEQSVATFLDMCRYTSHIYHRKVCTRHDIRIYIYIYIYMYIRHDRTGHIACNHYYCSVIDSTIARLLAAHRVVAVVEPGAETGTIKYGWNRGNIRRTRYGSNPPGGESDADGDKSSLRGLKPDGKPDAAVDVELVVTYADDDIEDVEVIVVVV